MFERVFLKALRPAFLAALLPLPAQAGPNDLENALRILSGAAILADTLNQGGQNTSPQGSSTTTNSPGKGRPKTGQGQTTVRPAVQADSVMLAAQGRLNALGYDAGRPDGKDGPRTRTAISMFQSQFGFPATGILTSAQRTLLLSDAALVTVRAQIAGQVVPVTVYTGFDAPGGDYRNPNYEPALQAISLDQCLAACASDQVCSAFTYNTDKGWCFLKQGALTAAPYEGAVSGIKAATELAQEPNTAPGRPLGAPQVAPKRPALPNFIVATQTPPSPDAPGQVAASATRQSFVEAPVRAPGSNAGVPSTATGAPGSLPALGQAAATAGSAPPKLGALGSPASTALPAMGAQSADITGIWRAAYTCGVSIQAELSISKSDKGSYEGRNLFTATDASGQSMSGEQEVGVYFEPATHSLRVDRSDWIRQPATDTYLMTSYRGTIDPSTGIYTVPSQQTRCREKQDIVFQRVPQQVLDEERARREALQQQFAQSPVAGAWQGWTMCTAGPLGVSFATTATDAGITARVRTFPLTQNPVPENMEYGAVMAQQGDAFVFQPAAEVPIYVGAQLTTQHFVAPFSFQVAAADTGGSLVGALDAPGCQGLTLSKIEADAFDNVFVRYDKNRPILTLRDVTPDRQVFSAPSLNAACEAIWAWENNLYRGYGTIRNFDSVRNRERKRPELPFAVFVPDQFVPFFGRDPAQLNFDEGTALASVVNRCVGEKYPLDIADELIAYVPNSQATARSGVNREYVDSAVEVVRASYEWRQSALAQLDGLSFQPSEKSTVTNLIREKEKHTYLLPADEQELEGKLSAATQRIDLAIAKENERRRKEHLDSLLATLADPTGGTTKAQLIELAQAGKSQELVLTPAQLAVFEDRLRLVLEPERKQLDQAVANGADADEIEKIAALVTPVSDQFAGYAPAKELEEKVTAARAKAWDAKMAEIDTLLAGTPDKQRLISAARLISHARKAGAGSWRTDQKRVLLSQRAEVWVSGFLQDEQSKAGPSAAADGKADSPAGETSQPSSSLLGDFADLVGAAAPASNGVSVAGLPEIFGNGVLKQPKLLQALYEGNFNAVYEVPRSTTNFYVIKFAEYFQQACPAALPSGMITYVARSQMPEDVLRGDPHAFESAGYDVLIKTLQQMAQPDRFLADGVRVAELQAQFEGDAMVLGQTFGCPGDGLRKIIESAFTFYKDPTVGVSAENMSLMDACKQSDEHLMTSGATRYCGCAVPILESSLSDNFQLYLKGNPKDRFQDIWSLFPDVAVEQQLCRL